MIIDSSLNVICSKKKKLCLLFGASKEGKQAREKEIFDLPKVPSFEIMKFQILSSSTLRSRESLWPRWPLLRFPAALHKHATSLLCREVATHGTLKFFNDCISPPLKTGWVPRGEADHHRGQVAHGRRLLGAEGKAWEARRQHLV